MTKIACNASVNGFSVQYGNNVIATKLDGGASRYRLDKIGSAHTVDVQWVLTDQGFNYFMAFYRQEMAYGSLPFEIDLKSIDGASLGTYTAHLQPGSLKSGAIQPNLHQVTATLEVTPAAVNESTDTTTIAGGPGE